MKTRKILSLALALALCLGLVPAAMAAEVTITEVVPCKYRYVNAFSEGLALVSSRSRGLGFIDKTGKEVIPCKYDEAESFSEGLAAVELDDKCGFLDKTGKEVIPLKYDEVKSFSEGLAAVELDDKWGFVDKTGKEVVPCKYESALSFSEGLAVVEGTDDRGRRRFGFVDTSGNEVVPCKYQYVHSFSDGLAAVKSNYLWGFIDKTGQEILPCQYDTELMYSFSDGLIAMWGPTGETDEWGKPLQGYGFLDKTGKVVVPYKYDDVEAFSEGLAAVRIGDTYTGKWGFIDTTGKEVVPCKYDLVDSFSEGRGAVRMRTGERGQYGERLYTCGYVDKTGKEVIPCKYSEAWDFSQGFAAVATNEYPNKTWGLIDAAGKEIVPSQYVGVGNYSEGMVPMSTYYEWGLIAVNGLTPAQQPAQDTAKPAPQMVEVDGEKVQFQMYAIEDAGGSTNYIRIRDLAALLDGTAAQFNVDWKGGRVVLQPKTPYTTRNGTEGQNPFTEEMPFTRPTKGTVVGDAEAALDAFVLNDGKGGNTYYKLRDLGQALGFNVGWSKARGIYLETDKPYDPSN